jgi:DNA-binding MarR family transcriptional regulator
MAKETESTGSGWTFLTNHGHVLLSIAKNPNLRLRDIAELVGITERSTQGIIADLAAGGYIEIKRDGRCNIYTTRPEKHLRHPIESHKQVADLIGLIEINGGKE